MAPACIVFLHGLESGPGGSKHRWLQEHYGDHVACCDMQMSLLTPFKANGILRQVLANTLFTAPWNLLGRSLVASLDGCLAAQREALGAARQRGGLVVGSSFGGAVALLALARGEWQGPTLLLAPAYGLVGRRAGSYDPSYAAEAVYAAISARLAGEDEQAAGRRRQILIVHGTDDATVPMADSRALAAATGIELVEVQGGDHRLNGALLSGEEPLLRALISRVTDGMEPCGG